MYIEKKQILERYSLHEKALKEVKGILKAAFELAYEEYWGKGNPSRFVIVEHTKTYKDRLFPRTSTLNEFLTRLCEVLGMYYPYSDFLFPANTENGAITNYMVYQFYSRICRKLGIRISREEIKGTHSFRRNAITDVVNASGGNLILAELFGNSPEIAKKNYYTGINSGFAILNTNRSDKIRT